MILPTAAALRRASLYDLFSYPDFKATIAYLTGLMTPIDARSGKREVPVIGDAVSTVQVMACPAHRANGIGRSRSTTETSNSCRQ